MPLIYQFQLQESLAMSSKSLRGIRHYELLNLSRRAKPEALEMMDLIEQYGNPNLPHQLIRTSRNNFVELDEKTNQGRVNINLNSQSADQTFNVKASVEAPEGVEATLSGKPEFKMPPGQQKDTVINFKLPENARPGFYHIFLRLEFGDDANKKIGYGWATVQKHGALKIEKDKATYPHPEVAYSGDALDYDFNRDLAVVYTDTRDDDNRWDVESAWLIYQTLEAATGRPVAIYQLNDLPEDVRKTGNLILVGTPKNLPSTQPAKGDPGGGHPLIASVMNEIKPSGQSWVARAKPNDKHGDWLVIAGEGEKLPEAEANMNAAAIDLVLRYWTSAKDSGARRVHLVDTPIETGPDPKLLP
jgi:hypothetical protein